MTGKNAAVINRQYADTATLYKRVTSLEGFRDLMYNSGYTEISSFDEYFAVFVHAKSSFVIEANVLPRYPDDLVFVGFIRCFPLDVYSGTFFQMHPNPDGQEWLDGFEQLFKKG